MGRTVTVGRCSFADGSQFVLSGFLSYFFTHIGNFELICLRSHKVFAALDTQTAAVS